MMSVTHSHHVSLDVLHTGDPVEDTRIGAVYCRMHNMSIAEEHAPLTVTAAEQLARDTAAAHHSLNSLTM
jgi:hypothetical protein